MVLSCFVFLHENQLDLCSFPYSLPTMSATALTLTCSFSLFRPGTQPTDAIWVGKPCNVTVWVVRRRPLTCIELMDPEWTPNLATLQARLQEETQQRTHEELSLRVTIDSLEMGLAENERRHQEFQANVQARLAEETHQRESGESSLRAGLGGLRSALVHIQRNQDQMQIEMAHWQHVQVRSLQDSGSDHEAGEPVENSTTEQRQRNKILHRIAQMSKGLLLGWGFDYYFWYCQFFFIGSSSVCVLFLWLVVFAEVALVVGRAALSVIAFVGHD